MNKFCKSRVLNFGTFTILCLGFPFSSLLAFPGICSRNFGGLIESSNYGINFILFIAISIIVSYIIISGIGLINLSGCLSRLGMPSDYPNAVARAFLYSSYRMNSIRFIKYEGRDSKVSFRVNSGYEQKVKKCEGNNEHNFGNRCNSPILTSSGDLKKLFALAMRTSKARVILAIVSLMVIICLSYISFIIFENSQIFFDNEKSEGGLYVFGTSSELLNSALLIFLTIFFIVLFNTHSDGMLVLCIISWIHFSGLIIFSLLSFFVTIDQKKDQRILEEFASKGQQFDWGVHIWGFTGGIIETGTFVVSIMNFYLLIPTLFKATSRDQEIKSSKIWAINISLVFFVIFCSSFFILGIVPSFLSLPNGFGQGSEGVSLTWRIFQLKAFENNLIFMLVKNICLLGSFFNWTLFASITTKCIDNIIRSILNEIECDFEFFTSNNNFISRKYYLRSAKQIYSKEIEDSWKGGGWLESLDDSANSTSIKSDYLCVLKRDIQRKSPLNLLRHTLNSVLAVGILLAAHYKLITTPQIIPLCKSVCISLFAILALILPCIVFWNVFYSDMIPRSFTLIQAFNLVFFGRVTTRNDMNIERSRERVDFESEKLKFACNPLLFGFFSISIPTILGCMIFVFESLKAVDMFLDLSFYATS
ncbi:putative integral membrane protein [Cryptosporidium felis]|nr:putative integral membrane protein [Cryptosporidium felis]